MKINRYVTNSSQVPFQTNNQQVSLKWTSATFLSADDAATARSIAHLMTRYAIVGKIMVEKYRAASQRLANSYRTSDTWRAEHVPSQSVKFYTNLWTKYVLPFKGIQTLTVEILQTSPPEKRRRMQTGCQGIAISPALDNNSVVYTPDHL